MPVKKVLSMVAVLVIGGFIMPTVASSSAKMTRRELVTLQSQELKPPLSMKRELKGGEKHTYPLMLKANDWLRLVVEQQGIDVVVRLIGPEGKTIQEVDSPNGSQGPEPLSFIIEPAGRYTLEIESFDKSAPPGNYELKLEEVKTASEEDRARIEIETLNAQAKQLQQAGKYDQGVVLAQQAVEKSENRFGPDHVDITASLNILGLLYSHKGDYARAEPLHVRALAIREKVLGPDHQETAISLNNLALLYQAKGDYARAEPLYVRALAIWEKVLGPDHQNVATILNNLAGLYQAKGDYARAEPLYVRVLAINEKALGPDHQDVAISLNNLAVLYNTRGESARAEPLYVRALAIREKTLGAGHPSVAQSLSNLATLYLNKGDYVRAESLYVRALAIWEKELGADHPTVATSLNNLATLYRAKGDYARAEPLYVRALAIREKVLGANHPETAQSLNTLAALYFSKGDYARAEPLYVRALAIREKALGANHYETAQSLNNLAALYREKGDYARAEPLYVRALAIWEKALGPDHPFVAQSLNNLAVVFEAKDDYARAESLMVRAMAIWEKAFGADHQSVAFGLINLALISQAKGDLTQAVRYFVRGNDTTERDLKRNLVSGSETQKALYLKQTAIRTDLTLSFHTQAAPGDPEAAAAALTVILRRKGRALDAMASAIETLRRQQTPDIQKLLDDYAGVNGQISALTLRGPGNKKPADHLAYLQELNRQREKLEGEISTRSAEFKSQFTPITLENVQKEIPPDTALVEYAVYRPFDTKTKKSGRLRYVAYVLRQGTGMENQGSGFRVPGSGPEFSSSKDSKSAGRRQTQTKQAQSDTVKPGTRNPEPGTRILNPGTLLWADLGDAQPIEEAVDAFRRALRNKVSADRSLKKVDSTGVTTQSSVKTAGQNLEKLIFEPVQKLLGPTTKVLLSPDGVLNLVPFDALVDDKHNYLVETFEFSYLTSGRDLLRLQTRIESTHPPLVVANPDYAVGKGPQLLGKQFAPLLPLPGTRMEAKVLKTIFPEAAVLLDTQATKAALTEANRPEFLHIGTHGLFLPDVKPEPVTATETTRLITRSNDLIDVEKIRAENPLLRSYLFFAGANQSGGNPENDGILTALEASGLNLWGTKLVVLSACETGLGDVRNGDGVYGLRRALVLAGSESQMVSLWPVSDASTRELMTRYYQLLKAGVGRSAAMRQIRLEFLKNPKRQHPFYWASFILSGDWKPL